LAFQVTPQGLLLFLATLEVVSQLSRDNIAVNTQASTPLDCATDQISFANLVALVHLAFQVLTIYFSISDTELTVQISDNLLFILFHQFWSVA